MMIQLQDYNLSTNILMKPEDQERDQPEDALLLKQVRYNSFKKLFFMVITICLSPFYFGYGISYLGTFNFDNIVIIFGITMDKVLANGLLQGCVPIGGGIGALSSSLLLKYFSRRNSLLFVNAIVLVITALAQFPNQYLIFGVRFFQGVCIGFYSALAPLIIKQFSPTQISGTLGAFNQFSVAFGVLFSNLFQFILQQISTQQQHWRYIFGLPFITTILQTILLLVVYNYETPKYLLENNREQDCREVLRYIYKEQFIEEVLNQKKEDLGMSTETAPRNDEIPKNKQSTITSQDQDNKPKKKNNIRLFVAIHLAMLQQFVGINIVVGYGSDLVAQVLPSLKSIIPVILNLQQTVASFSTSYLLSKYGRKTLLQRGTILFVISLLMITLGFILQNSVANLGNTLVIVGLVIFMADFGLSLGPVVWVLIPQLVQPSKVPIAVGANWGSAAFIMILFPILKTAVGLWPLFLFFAIYCIIGFFISQKFVIQTKGKEQKQIYAEYDKVS